MPFKGKWTGWRNRPTVTLEFSQGKYQALLLRNDNSRHQYRLEVDWLESSSVEKKGALVNTNLTMSQQCAFQRWPPVLHEEEHYLQIKGGDSSSPASPGETYLSAVLHAGLPSTRDTWTYSNKCIEGQQR